MDKPDVINHPNHYTWIPGIETNDVTKNFNFNTGAAMKYIWRHRHKGTPIQDLRKAIKHIEMEIEWLEEKEK